MKENPSTEPFTAFQNKENQVLQQMLSSPYKAEKTQLKQTVTRYLEGLKTQASIRNLAVQVSVVNDGLPVSVADTSEYMQKLSDGSYNFNATGKYQDITKSIQLLNATTKKASKQEIQTLNSSLQTLSNFILTRHQEGVKDKTVDPMLEGFQMQSPHKVSNQGGLYGVLSGFIESGSQGKSYGQTINIEALHAFSEYVASSEKQERLFIESKFCQKLSSNLQVQLIRNTEKLSQPQKNIDEYLEDKLEQIEDGT